jgi:hypothetical protein
MNVIKQKIKMKYSRYTHDDEKYAIHIIRQIFSLEFVFTQLSLHPRFSRLYGISKYLFNEHSAFSQSSL